MPGSYTRRRATSSASAASAGPTPAVVGSGEGLPTWALPGLNFFEGLMLLRTYADSKLRIPSGGYEPDLGNGYPTDAAVVLDEKRPIPLYQPAFHDYVAGTWVVARQRPTPTAPGLRHLSLALTIRSMTCTLRVNLRPLWWIAGVCFLCSSIALARPGGERQPSPTPRPVPNRAPTQDDSLVLHAPKDLALATGRRTQGAGAGGLRRGAGSPGKRRK